GVAAAMGRAPRVALPLAAGTPAAYRLRLWSLDRRESSVHLAVAAPTVTVAGEGDLRKGLNLGAASGLSSSVVRVALDRPGLLRVTGDAALWCAGRGQACRPLDGELVAAPQKQAW